MVPVQLELTADILRALINDMTDDQMHWKPAPGRFSIAETLAHLAHAELYAYNSKYEQFAKEQSPMLEPYDTDGLVERGEYTGKNALKSLADFERQRAVNLTLLRSLPPDCAARTGQHRKVGLIALAELLNECAFHDLGHIRQVAELVRAQKYYPKMGLYARYNKVNP